MTMLEAVKEVLAGVRPGLRGVGCAVIHTAKGEDWSLMDEHEPPLVERTWHEDGRLCHQLRHAKDFPDEVVRVEWSTDESGAIKGSPGN